MNHTHSVIPRTLEPSLGGHVALQKDAIGCSAKRWNLSNCGLASSSAIVALAWAAFNRTAVPYQVAGAASAATIGSIAVVHGMKECLIEGRYLRGMAEIGMGMLGIASAKYQIGTLCHLLRSEKTSPSCTTKDKDTPPSTESFQETTIDPPPAPKLDLTPDPASSATPTPTTPAPVFIPNSAPNTTTVPLQLDHGKVKTSFQIPEFLVTNIKMIALLVIGSTPRFQEWIKTTRGAIPITFIIGSGLSCGVDFGTQTINQWLSPSPPRVM